MAVENFPIETSNFKMDNIQIITFNVIITLSNIYLSKIKYS